MPVVILPGDLESYMQRVDRQMREFDGEMLTFSVMWPQKALELFNAGRTDTAEDLTRAATNLDRAWAELYRGTPLVDDLNWRDFYAEHIGTVFLVGTRYNQVEEFQRQLIELYDDLDELSDGSLKMAKPSLGFDPVNQAEDEGFFGDVGGTTKAVLIGGGVLLGGIVLYRVTR